MNGTNYGGVIHAGLVTNGTDILPAGNTPIPMAPVNFGTKEGVKYLVKENRYVRLRSACNHCGRSVRIR